jgi:excisionase family DNA binding protein
MTTAEVAAEAQVTPKTVTRWVADGSLTPAAKLPGLRGAYLFDRTAINAYIKASRKSGTDAA